MIRAWRLSKARYAADLTGQGAAREGQRWNPPGQRAVYLGFTCAYDVPDRPGLILEPDDTALPEGCNAVPHGQASAVFGGEWLRAGDQALIFISVRFLEQVFRIGAGVRGR